MQYNGIKYSTEICIQSSATCAISVLMSSALSQQNTGAATGRSWDQCDSDGGPAEAINTGQNIGDANLVSHESYVCVKGADR